MSVTPSPPPVTPHVSVIRRHAVPLDTAIRNNASTVAQTQSAYQQSVLAVTSCMQSVLGSSIPPLVNGSPYLAQFETASTNAAGEALNWVNTVLAPLLNVPQEVALYAGTIASLLADAGSQASALIKNPADAQALAALKTDLASLDAQFKLVSTFTTGAAGAATAYTGNLAALTTQVATIAADATNQANVDTQAVVALSARVRKLNGDIGAQSERIASTQFGNASAITIGVLLTIADFPLGATGWLGVGPVVAANNLVIDLANDQITADTAAVKETTDQLTGLSADTAVLAIIANAYSDLLDQTRSTYASLAAVANAWIALQTDVAAAIAAVAAALDDVASTGYTRAASDVAKASTEWQSAAATIGLLTLDLLVNDAPLSVGQPSSEVQAALAAGTVTDPVTYFNNLGA